MLNLFELDDKVSCNISSCLMAHLLENKLAAFTEAWLHLDLLYSAYWMDRLSIMVNHVAVIVDCFHRATVELF